MLESIKIKSGDRSDIHPLMNKIKDIITPYGYDLHREQFIISSR